MNTSSMDPFMGFEKNFTDIFEAEIDFKRSVLPHTPTRPSFPTEELVKRKEKSENAKFQIFDDPNKPMPVLIDSRTTAQDELKIAEALNYQESVGYVSKYAADQILASSNEERAEPFNNESIPYIEFEDRKKDTKYKAGSSTISTTQSTQRLFAPYLSQNNSGDWRKVFGNIRNRNNSGKEKDGKTIVDARFCYKNYIPQRKIYVLKMRQMISEYNENLLKSVIQKLDSK